MAKTVKYRKGRKAHASGLLGEWVALLLLLLKGYRFLGWRHRTLFGEVDLVMADRRRQTLVLVEVKNHRSMAHSLTAIAPAQQKRLKAAAAIITAKMGKHYPTTRFDAVFWSGWHWPKHLENAFD